MPTLLLKYLVSNKLGPCPQVYEQCTLSYPECSGAKVRWGKHGVWVTTAATCPWLLPHLGWDCSEWAVAGWQVVWVAPSGLGCKEELEGNHKWHMHQGIAFCLRYLIPVSNHRIQA